MQCEKKEALITSVFNTRNEIGKDVKVVLVWTVGSL